MCVRACLCIYMSMGKKIDSDVDHKEEHLLEHTDTLAHLDTDPEKQGEVYSCDFQCGAVCCRVLHRVAVCCSKQKGVSHS